MSLAKLPLTTNCNFYGWQIYFPKAIQSWQSTYDWSDMGLMCQVRSLLEDDRDSEIWQIVNFVTKLCWLGHQSWAAVNFVENHLLTGQHQRSHPEQTGRLGCEDIFGVWQNLFPRATNWWIAIVQRLLAPAVIIGSDIVLIVWTVQFEWMCPSLGGKWPNLGSHLKFSETFRLWTFETVSIYTLYASKWSLNCKSLLVVSTLLVISFGPYDINSVQHQVLIQHRLLKMKWCLLPCHLPPEIIKCDIWEEDLVELTSHHFKKPSISLLIQLC